MDSVMTGQMHYKCPLYSGVLHPHPRIFGLEPPLEEIWRKNSDQQVLSKVQLQEDEGRAARQS